MNKNRNNKNKVNPHSLFKGECDQTKFEPTIGLKF